VDVQRLKAWSEGVAELAADALVDAGLLAQEDFARASAVVAEEIFVRLILGDWPQGDAPTLPE
jgi:hypothetical protein